MSLTIFREKLFNIGAKDVRHGRYVTFQLAEVANPRELFAETLRRIDRLNPQPCETDPGSFRGLRKTGSCMSRMIGSPSAVREVVTLGILVSVTGRFIEDRGKR